ncbi:hypothetical protein EZV61_11425 [Corallincola luteus]|uniref:DUF3576 domain-containing protein n=1 Tax=Corallincola luteus TaxID=1775177 RepID=A0ABY2AMP7_9GAMM|nr:hypothetical protein [Corallincola luteus]TCI02898.1 hypothetical protein EZV61_11425 [Corallincola luteus]
MRQILICILVVCMTACSGTISTISGEDGAPAKAYILSNEAADRLIHSAMTSEFADKDIKPVSDPYPGYAAEVAWGVLDSDTVTAYYRKVKAVDSEGKSVTAVVFLVKHYGTAPASGIPTSERLLKRIVSDAELLVEGVDFSHFVD